MTSKILFFRSLKSGKVNIWAPVEGPMLKELASGATFHFPTPPTGGPETLKQPPYTPNHSPGNLHPPEVWPCTTQVRLVFGCPAGGSYC